MRESSEKIVFVRIKGRIGSGAWGDDARDFAAYEFRAELFPGELGIFHLLADGDFETFPDEFADVAFGGVVGNPAHGNGDTFFFVTGGKCDLQFFRGYDGIVEKKLVEISQAKK